MTDNKVELIKLILENDDVDQAILTAAAIISDFLKQEEGRTGKKRPCKGEEGSQREG